MMPLTAEYGFLKERSDGILSVFISALDWQGASLPKGVQPSKSQVLHQSREVHPSSRGSYFFGNTNGSIVCREYSVACRRNLNIGIPYNNPKIRRGIMGRLFSARMAQY